MKSLVRHDLLEHPGSRITSRRNYQFVNGRIERRLEGDLPLGLPILHAIDRYE